ncbi:MAG: tRNA (N6-threonylcarbamoyladenosine(37)-N6)-methyltransferase TrmO [Cyanobacteriota bacterium]
MNEYTVKPIGYVKNEIPDRKSMNTIGFKSSLIIYDEFLPALDYIQENSHIIVFCFFHQAQRDILRVFPRKFGVSYQIEKGVFATRSPDRPNPISFTITKLIEVKKNEVIVERLDAINNTPVLDIKPYSFGSDAVYNTQSLNKKTDFVNPTDEMIYEYLKVGLLNYITQIDDSFELGINAILKAIKTLNAMPDRDIIDHVETDFNGNALDTIYYYVKYTPGENKINTNYSKSTNTYIKFKLLNGETIKIVNNTKINKISLDILELLKS